VPVVAGADGTKIYYETHGSGPAVVFVHGTGGHHMAWWQQVVGLRDRYTTVTLDLRGFGRSPVAVNGPIDARLFVDDVGAVLDQLARDGAGPVVLVGQSIGGTIALKAALRSPHPVAGVVLAASLGGVDSPELAALARNDRAAADAMPVLDRLLSAEFQRSRPDTTFLFQQMGTFNMTKMADIINAGSDPVNPDALDAAGFPVLLIAGENDAVLTSGTARRAGELLRAVDVEVVPDGPHSMYFERPDLFNASLERFLGRAFATSRAHS
jgi:pimeloyl-ACP methyl ester carboxylesterase